MDPRPPLYLHEAMLPEYSMLAADEHGMSELDGSIRRSDALWSNHSRRIMCSGTLEIDIESANSISDEEV